MILVLGPEDDVTRVKLRGVSVTRQTGEVSVCQVHDTPGYARRDVRYGAQMGQGSGTTVRGELPGQASRDVLGKNQWLRCRSTPAPSGKGELARHVRPQMA